MIYMNYDELSRFTFPDKEKLRMIDKALNVQLSSVYMIKRMDNFDMDEACDFDAKYDYIDEYSIPGKFCPKCHEKYSSEENFCLDCGTVLKDIRHVDVGDIWINPAFTFEGSNHLDDFNEILTEENLKKITVNDFDIPSISDGIRLTAIRRLDDVIKKNSILLDDLSVLEKVMLFTKSFVDVKSKSYGAELGYYEFNRIYVDDRSLDALQITTLLHELAHFLMKEILSQVLCEILDCDKTSHIESVATYILSYSPLNQLVDEYAAHTVEGRFTLYGFQDYSSFLSIQSSINLAEEEIEMLKTIGNTFANIIKDIIESFINENLLDDIKNQFRDDIMDQPDYKNLRFENCTLLNEEGLKRAARFILHDGFAVAMDNIPTLEQYNLNWSN